MYSFVMNVCLCVYLHSSIVEGMIEGFVKKSREEFEKIIFPSFIPLPMRTESKEI